jgi:hypothetical protein
MAKDPEQWSDLLREQMGKESDRAIVILCAAMLETALETIVKSRLVPIASADDSLLEGVYAPISSFSAKIDLAHRIGLLSAKFARDLHIIRRIRNDFAHNVQSCSFGHAAMRSRVAELARSSGIIEHFPGVRKAFVEGTRGDFLMIISWMLWYLWQLAGEVNSIQAAEPEWGYTELPEAKEG